MLKNCLTLSLGVMLMVTAFRLEGAGLRDVSPDEAELVKGAACPLQGMNPKPVCGAGSVSGGACWWGGTQPCAVNQCKIDCTVLEEQKVTAGCSWGLPICSTVPCIAATSANAACPARTYMQETCNAPWGCVCGSPTTRVNCPAANFTQWSSCP